jgi:hypothetical protein
MWVLERREAVMTLHCLDRASSTTALPTAPVAPSARTVSVGAACARSRTMNEVVQGIPIVVACAKVRFAGIGTMPSIGVYPIL